MALANNCLDSIHQPCTAFKPGGPFGFEAHHASDNTIKNLAMITINNNNSSSPSSASSSGGGFGFRSENCHEEAHLHHENSLINFKAGGGYDHDHHQNFMHDNASLLSFDQQNQKDHDYSVWEGSNQWNQHQISPKYSSDPRLMEDFNCFDTASNYGFMMTNTSTSTSTTSKNQNHGDWLFSEATTVTDCVMESGSQDHTASLKRPHSGESSQALKKQCAGATTKNKPKSSVASKDPQSIAAKNRRERISERLKTLQELVPNGSKVDLVTMLEKAISYVKFLQLQVKVLATDEFWPVQGGKAPDISQVKEAIDAILSSQRDRNSSSK
ncbi:hypothetical protein LWI29_014369 [Acer saccharum]|uniref:BHLH domain-containing protein n=1 Tax=Acer saccharum TaxID=4024 RepID=A0AA39SN32_ACESA|nr:hypothetical protein LWI29_014369 [Acer saccharum]